MTDFPGNIMVIDDQFDLVYQPEPQDANKIQYVALKDIKDYCEAKGIPLISISKTTEISDIKKRMELYSNVRMLILDLDLNNDGKVENDDIEAISTIIKIALKQYGYFLLLINSAHTEAWKDIKTNMPKEINANFIETLSFVYDKNDTERINKAIEKLESNYSLELIYDFECTLNKARDQALSNFIDFKKETWQILYKMLYEEGGELANSDISNILLSTLKPYLNEVKYSLKVVDQNSKAEPELSKAIYKAFYYTDNKNGILEKQKIWTGNLFETDMNHDKRYALVITPECDVSNDKHFYHKIVFGFQIDKETFPDSYNHDDYNDGKKDPPVFPHRAGKTSKKKWRKKSELQDASDKFDTIIDHFYVLKYIVVPPIYLDFRDVSAYPDETIKKWKLILRINEPMITNIIDKYSNLQNRKGLLPIY